MTTEHEQPDITVSIVSYNTRDLLRMCLKALQVCAREDNVKLQIVVPDNGSTDGSVQMVQSEFPEVEAFSTGGNLGYGRANNMSFARARGRYFLALNSDTEVEPGALRQLTDFLDTHPEAAAVGAQLVWPDGRPQTSFGDDPHLSDIWMEQIYLNKLKARLQPAPEPDTLDATAADDTQPREVDQICGACQFVRSEAYRQIEGYDPAYFMYHEDVDLNIRLRQNCGKLYFLPTARIRHHLGASSSRNWRTRARMVSALNWSRYYYFSRHGNPAQGPTLKIAFILGAAMRLTAWTFIALARPAQIDKVKIFREVFRRACRMTPDKS